jgi:hypothetical protein
MYNVYKVVGLGLQQSLVLRRPKDWSRIQGLNLIRRAKRCHGGEVTPLPRTNARLSYVGDRKSPTVSNEAVEHNSIWPALPITPFRIRGIWVSDSKIWPRIRSSSCSRIFFYFSSENSSSFELRIPIILPRTTSEYRLSLRSDCFSQIKQSTVPSHYLSLTALKTPLNI